MEKIFDVLKGAEPNILDRLYANKNWNRAMDLIRIIMLVGVVVIIVVLITNINEVKLLNSDVCSLCMQKTGANCWYGKLT